MTEQLIAKLLPEVQKHIVCDKMYFVETKKFNNTGLPKSLYVILAAVNINTGLTQKVTYGVHDRYIDFTLHPARIKK